MKDCIISHYSKDRDGYPQGYDFLTKKSTRHHRQVYKEHYGEIPKGLIVRHKCDNPGCINIEHLELGTQADNMQDKMQRGRAKTKLTDEQVLAIRSDTRSLRAIAKDYNIVRSTVYDIKTKKSWKHI